MRHLAALLALLCACEPPTPADPAPSMPAIDGVADACIRSFRPTLDAWEAANGRVPDVCAYLDTQYSVELVPASELPCVSEADNEQVVACTQPEEHAIYLLEGRDELALLDSSVHEWLHAIEDCAHGDRDREHLRAGVWTQDGAGSVEVTAQAAALTGTCLAAGFDVVDALPVEYQPFAHALVTLLLALAAFLKLFRPLANRLPVGRFRIVYEWVDKHLLEHIALNSKPVADRALPRVPWNEVTPAERPSRKPGARGGQ